MTKNNYVQMVNLNLLNIDNSYRTPECEIEGLVEHFNALAVGIITINKRNDGSLYIVDGFRRVAALKEKGFDKWQCFLHDGYTAKEEAKLFIDINEFSSFDDFEIYDIDDELEDEEEMK